MRELLKQALGSVPFLQWQLTPPACLHVEDFFPWSSALFLCEHLLRAHRIEPGSDCELYHSESRQAKSPIFVTILVHIFSFICMAALLSSTFSACSVPVTQSTYVSMEFRLCGCSVALAFWQAQDKFDFCNVSGFFVRVGAIMLFLTFFIWKQIELFSFTLK